MTGEGENQRRRRSQVRGVSHDERSTKAQAAPNIFLLKYGRQKADEDVPNLSRGERRHQADWPTGCRKVIPTLEPCRLGPRLKLRSSASALFFVSHTNMVSSRTSIELQLSVPGHLIEPLPRNRNLYAHRVTKACQ